MWKGIERPMVVCLDLIMKRALRGMLIGATALGVSLAAAVAVAEDKQPKAVLPKTMWPNAVLPGDPLPEGVVPSPELDYGQYFRIVTNFNDTSSSKCIGYPITPMCAVETYMASDLREDEVLRAIALGERPGPPETFKDASAYNSGIHGYRVTSVRLFLPYIIPVSARNRFNIQAGDVAMSVETNVCTYAPCTEGALNSDENYLLRKGKYGWHIVPAGAYRYDITDTCDFGYRSCSD